MKRGPSELSLALSRSHLDYSVTTGGVNEIEPEQTLVILSDCLKRWVELEFLTEEESLSLYAEVGVALYEDEQWGFGEPPH